MATKKIREHLLGAGGVYDIIHRETEASLVVTSDNGNMQDKITALGDALAGKAPASHGHAQADITGLVAALAGKQAQHTTAAVTLTVAGWSGNSQTVAVAGVTASNTVIVAPAAASQEDSASAKIVCTAQGAGTLTFGCETVPTAAIAVNVVILGV